jgi:hypothetical protein
MNMGSLTRSLRAFVCVLFVCSLLSGCLTTKAYVDPALPRIAKTDLVAVAQPQPVQVLFEFRTKGNSNAKATGMAQPRVIAIVNASGLFSAASANAGATEAGTLKIIIDNVPQDQHGTAKGVGTGLTFGLAGSLVTDGYVCTASYSHNGHTTETIVKHALYSTIGNHSPPQGLQPMELQAAVYQIIDQMTWNSLKQLDDKHAFE